MLSDFLSMSNNLFIVLLKIIVTYFPDNTNDRLSTFVAFSCAYTSWYFRPRIILIHDNTFLNWCLDTLRGWNNAIYTWKEMICINLFKFYGISFVYGILNIK